MSPLPLPKGGGHCFLDRSRRRQRRRRRKTSCLLCNLNTLWNIFMILGRNVDQGKMTCHIQDWQLWLSYFWSYHPLLYLKKISCPLCKSNTFWNISMVTLPFLLWASFVMSDSDYPLISCPLYKFKTLWNIFMILGRNIGQDQMACRIKNDNSAFLTFSVISLCYIWQW